MVCKNSQSLQFMKQYNALIKKHQKAIQFFQDNQHLVDLHINRYRNIVNAMDNLISLLEKSGYSMSDEEISEGFRQVEYLQI